MAEDAPDHSPHLLLTAQRLRRLKRDRERQTVRWTNFENRVQSAPDSPERGFELALYYAVTGNEKRGREAVQWSLAHLCERRQAALVMDWADALASPDERRQLRNAACQPDAGSEIERLRNQLFLDISRQKVTDIDEAGKSAVLESIENGKFADARQLYAACEYLSAARTNLHVDLREDAKQFFLELPTEFVLALKPEAVEHPDWTTHIAALALVALDPNLEGSQYVQGWAMEDRQMIREGRGVAYEFLWADPYLPGVGYQNLDPWVYDSAGRLLARSDWTPNACWIDISTGGVQEENCPPKWRETVVSFGHLRLVPMTGPCTELPQRKNNETAIIWRLRPNHSITYVEDKQQRSAQADTAGLWRAPPNVGGKVCVAR